MTKGSNRLIKSDAASRDEQNICFKKETPDMARENKKTSMNDSFRQSSQKLLQKLRKITLGSIPERKSNNLPEETSFDTSQTIHTITSEANGELKLKGILKNSTKNVSCSDSINDLSNKHDHIQASESHLDIHHEINNKENSDDLISSDNGSNRLGSTSNSLKAVKHVSFNDETSEIRYKPYKPIFGVMALSYRQQKKLKKLQRRDSLSLHSMNLTGGYSLNSSKFQEFSFYESSEDESSDDNNED